MTTIESWNDEELIEIALRISSDSQKLKEEEEVRFLVLDMLFYSNYFFTLGKHSWWRMRDDDIKQLSYKFTENQKMGHDILDSIQDYRVDDPNNRVSVLDEKMADSKKQVVKDYSVLLNAKPDESSFISCKELVQFINNICYIASEMLRCRRDLDDKAKRVIEASRANLRFFVGFLRLGETEGMRSVMSCIQGYTREVEHVLFRFWTGIGKATVLRKGRWMSCMLSLLPDKYVFQWSRLRMGENNFQIFVWESILACIPEFLNDCYSKDLLDYISRLSLTLPFVDTELEGGIRHLHDQLTFMDNFLEDLSLDMRVLYIRAAASYGFLCAFSFRDASEQVIEHAKFQVSIMSTILYFSGVELMSTEQTSHELVDGLKFLRECLKDTEDEYLEEDNWVENNVNQILFVIETGDVATELSQLISLSNTMNMTVEVKLRVRHLIVDIQLLVADQALNRILNRRVDSSIEMLRKGIRLLRILFTDSTMEGSADKHLLVSGDELMKDAMLFAAKLCSNSITTEMDDFVSNLLRNLIPWESNVTARYVEIRSSSQSTHPRTDTLGFIDCLEDNLSNLLSKTISASSSWMKYQIKRALKDSKSCRSLLNDVLRGHEEDNELDNLVSRLTQAAYEAEYVAESFVIRDGNAWTKRLWISDLIDEIKQISTEIKDRVLLLQPVDNNTPLTNKVVVGMEEQEKTVTNQLIRGSTKLGVVSIVGMGGLGKTTLAKKLFNSPSVQHSFDVRAWCSISKVYRKRDILLEILGCVVEVTSEIRRMTDDALSNRLRQLLLQRSYLIVMDDMWDILAWKEIQLSFPKDETRSRILFTSRINDIALESGYGFEPCSLDLLSDTQSWELLEKKVFEGGSCPLHLRKVGWEIATKCKGLPLAIVVISGLLSSKEMNLDWWKQVAENLKSIVVGNSTNVIELSYRYLPDYLKPCFLYFSAFKEDERVLVSNLIDLWTAEGFIRKTRKNDHDVARDYLTELVTRNLVNVAERTSMGGIKACHVHDLLHELCRAKAEEESFLHVVKKDMDSTVKYEHRRVCVYSKRKEFIESRPSGQCVRSLLLFPEKEASSYYSWLDYNASFISLNFKLLRTLKLDSISIGDTLPNGFELLVHLRFLAVLGSMMTIPGSIKCLSNLEFLYVKGIRGEIRLPLHSIWKLKKLRNVQVKDQFAFDFGSIEESLDEFDNLESLSTVFLPDRESIQSILHRLLRLRKLKCIFTESWNSATTKSNRFPVLSSLNQLESLKVLYHGTVWRPSVFSFPATLKKLTLSKFRLPWKDISTIGSLPCLEVLKLLFKAFEGQEWEMESEGGLLFQNLKYLKLESLDIVRWTTSFDSFPCLEKLVLQSCKKLEEVPFAFGESSTLQMIQVHWCSSSVAQSVKAIQDEQKDNLGRELNVLIHPPDFRTKFV